MTRKRNKPFGELETLIYSSEKYSNFCEKYESLKHSARKFARCLYAQYKESDRDANWAYECIQFAEETFCDVEENTFASAMLGLLLGVYYASTFEGVDRKDVRKWTETLKCTANSKPFYWLN